MGTFQLVGLATTIEPLTNTFNANFIFKSGVRGNNHELKNNCAVYCSSFCKAAERKEKNILK